MNNGHGLALPPGMMPQPQELQVAAPLNDVQLVALVAAQRGDLEPIGAVEWAQEVVANAIALAPRMGEVIQAAKAAMADEAAGG